MEQPPNPYAPPGAPPPVAPVRVFGPWAVALHTFLLPPAFGVALDAINHRRVGDAKSYAQSVRFLLAPTTALLLLLLFVRDAEIRKLLGIASFVVSVGLAPALYTRNKRLLAQHETRGGPRARWYLATLAFLGVYTVLLGVAQLVSPS